MTRFLVIIPPDEDNTGEDDPSFLGVEAESEHEAMLAAKDMSGSNSTTFAIPFSQVVDLMSEGKLATRKKFRVRFRRQIEQVISQEITAHTAEQVFAMVTDNALNPVIHPGLPTATDRQLTPWHVAGIEEVKE